jgi:hypothetical protein
LRVKILFAPDTGREAPATARPCAERRTAPRGSRPGAATSARLSRGGRQQGPRAGCGRGWSNTVRTGGALKLLTLQGAAEARTNRGVVLHGPVTTAPRVETVNAASYYYDE